VSDRSTGTYLIASFGRFGNNGEYVAAEDGTIKIVIERK
jgi:hypothetical protein